MTPERRAFLEAEVDRRRPEMDAWWAEHERKLRRYQGELEDELRDIELDALEDRTQISNN